MRPPIAYTYEADTHCPDCAVARFGKDPTNRCAVCGEAANRNPISMAGTMHRYGPTSHEYVPGMDPWPPEDARDSEGNPVGAIAPWDDWCNGEDEAVCTLTCGDCLAVLDTHGPHITPED